MTEVAEFEPVCKADEVAPNALRAVTLSDGTRACVGHRGGAFFALVDRCPHQKFPLSEGHLAADGTIVCSWHGAAYDCATGRSTRGPLRDGGKHEAPLGRVQVLEVQVTGGEVYVRPPQPGF